MSKIGSYLKFHLELRNIAPTLACKSHKVRKRKPPMRVKMSKLMKYGENTIKKAVPKIRAIRTGHGRFPSLG